MSWRGRAAHIASREQEALELYRRAEVFAPTPAARRDTLWGQLLCAIELELPEAAERMRVLASGVHVRTPERSCNRRHTGWVTVASLGSWISRGPTRHTRCFPRLRSARRVVLPKCVFVIVLASLARYDDALRVSEEFHATTTRYRLDFAIPYALTSTAVAVAGLRRWARSQECARQALERSRRTRDIAAQQHAFSVYLRVLAQQRRHQSALALEAPSLCGRRSQPHVPR